MVKLSLFLNLLIISSVMSRNSKRGKPKKVSRPLLIGGTPADIRNYPFQVSQRKKRDNSHNCGGALISQKFVITAAHCIYLKDTREFYIWVGSTTLSGKGNRYEIESAVCHENFSTTFQRDIGLIGVKNKFVFRDTIKPVSILLNEIPPGNILTVTGWGKIENNVFPDNLQMVQVDVISLKECKERFPRYYVVTDAQVCTFVKNRKAGMCAGDSGGPLTYDGHLVGLVSWGKEGCAAGYPDVNTKLAAYKTWINDNINKYCRKWPCPKNVLPNYVKS